MTPFRRIARRTHLWMLHNHNKILLVGLLALFSCLSYHLPLHIRDGNFVYLEAKLQELAERYGVHTLELASAVMGTFCIFLFMLLLITHTAYMEMHQVLGLNHRRKYADFLFIKLIAKFKALRSRLPDSEIRLSDLEALREEVLEIVARFRADADKILTPSMDEIFADPEEFYHISDEELKKNSVKNWRRIHLSETSLHKLMNPQ